MSASPADGLLRRAAAWLVEPADGTGAQRVDGFLWAGGGHLDVDCAEAALEAGGPAAPPALAAVARRRHPVIGVVGLARRCGATTLARALGTELAVRRGGPAIVTAPRAPAVVALGGSQAAVRLVRMLPELQPARAAGRLCLATCAEPAVMLDAAAHLAPTVMEIEAGCPAVEAAQHLDRMVLVCPPDLEPALAEAVAETVADAGGSTIVAANRAADHGAWLTRAAVLVPDSRIGARLALAGREPRRWFGSAIEHLADACVSG